jgi:FeS assembly SUF system protein
VCDVSEATTIVPAGELRAGVIAALRGIYDPEIPLNIYDLGLVYALEHYEGGRVRILMTLTTPNCPAAQDFPAAVEKAVRDVPGVAEAEVELVWEPPWTPERMSEASRLSLGLL